MDDQIDPGDNFFGINLSDCVTVAANSLSNAHTEPQDAPKRPFGEVADVVTVTTEMVAAGIGAYEDDTRLTDVEIFSGIYRAMAAVAPQDQPQIPIMDSVVGLKAANAHLMRRVTELELQDRAWARIVDRHQTDNDVDLNEKIASLSKSVTSRGHLIVKLEAQLAAQAVAHAEQMEGKDRKIAELEARGSTIDAAYDNMLVARDRRIAELETEVANWQDAWAKERDFWRAQMQHQLSAMRVTPATQPTDAQLTAADASATAPPERRPDGTLKPAAKVWEAPKRPTDMRRLGG